MRTRCALLLVPLLLGACDSNPTAPNSPPVPFVAGSYSGTVRTSDAGVICATTTSVTQSGSSVTIGPLQVGECINGPTNFAEYLGLSNIPFSRTTIDETGRLGPVNGTLPNSLCGFSYWATPSFDPNLRMYLIVDPASEETCYGLRLTVNLTKQ